MRRARGAVVALCLVAAGCAGRGGGDADAGALDLAAGGELGAGVADQLVHVKLRAVNLCGSAVDLYVAGSVEPFAREVELGQVTGYVDATLGALHGELEARPSGAAVSTRALATSSAVRPAEGDRVTVELHGRSCAIMPMVEKFGEASAGSLRVRFVDAEGKSTPTRLYWEQPDGSFAQAAAVDPYGESGPDGALVPTPGAGQDSVRVQVAGELSSTPGTPGYQIPAAALRPGARLFLFAVAGARGVLSLLVVDEAGPAPFAVAAGDPPGFVRINPNLGLLNAVPDLCGTGPSHFVFTSASGRTLAALDVPFGSELRLSLPPTSGGHTITATPALGCVGPSGGNQVVAAPLAAGVRYLQAVFGAGAAADGALFGRTLVDALPSGTPAPAIAFANFALGASTLDVDDVGPGAPDSDGGATRLFAAVPFGAMTAWRAPPDARDSLRLVQAPNVSLSLASDTSFVVLAVGAVGSSASVPLALLTHTIIR